MRVGEGAVITNGAMAGPLNATMSVRNGIGWSIQGEVTSAAGLSGTLKVQARNGTLNFTDIAGASFAIAGNGDWVFNYHGAHYDDVKLVWVPGAGTGVLNSAGRKKEPAA